MPRHCKNCGEEGHERRTCNDEELKEGRNEFFKRIKRRDSVEEILENAKSIYLEKMKLLTYKTEEGKLTRIVKLTEKEDQYYENLEKYIKKEYEKQEKELAKLLEKKLQMMRIQGIPMMIDHQMLYVVYMQTIRERNVEIRELISRENYPSERIEIPTNAVDDTTVHTILTRDLSGLLTFINTRRISRDPHPPSYETMTLWLGYILLIIKTYQPPKPINYNFIKRLIRDMSRTPETIECPICMECITTPEISEVNCGHKFCRTCIRRTISTCPKKNRCGCPMCRTPVDTIIRKYYE